MAEHTVLRKLLILRGPALDAEGILPLLREHFDVESASQFDEAMSAIRDHHFDAVLAETADFLPLERGIVTQQAGVVLDTIGDGVCIVGPGGELAWANRRLREYAPEVVQGLREICVKAYEELAAGSSRDECRGRKFSLMPENGYYYEVICSPVRDKSGTLRQVVAVVVDCTIQRRQQLKLNAIDRAGRELVNLGDPQMTRSDAATRLRMLQTRIIRFSQEVLNFQHFAVLLLDGRNNRLEMIFSEGLDAGASKYELFASTDKNGICGYVAATGRSYICPDVRRDSRYLPGLGNARSSLTVPLRMHDKVIGVLNVESDAIGAFSEEDRQFAEIFANYVAMALHILNLLVFERHTAHTQVSDSICADLSGPLNDIITEATELIEDYIGHDDLRRRLQTIVDQASAARKHMQQLQNAPRTGVLSAPAEPAQRDPILTGKRILVADDEELIRTTVRDVLIPYGCDVQIACDGAEAIRLIDAGRFDLVISDIKMPGATGYDVFSAAKTHCACTEVILITAFGYDPNHSIVRANREGLGAVLMKPFKVRELLDECRTALSRKK